MGAGLVQGNFCSETGTRYFSPITKSCAQNLESPIFHTRCKNHRDPKNYCNYIFLQDILQSVETHQTQIEETIVRGKELSQKEGALDLVPSNVSTLETLSSEVLNDCKVRREEIETALNNWTRYNEGLEGFKEVLADGEVEVTRRKALNVTGLEVVDQEKQEIKVLWQS